METTRGIIISPSFSVLPEGGFCLHGEPDASSLRKYLLYWDEIEYPDNNIVSYGSSPDIEYLQKNGVLKRPRVQFHGTINTGNGEFLIQAQQRIFESNNEKQPGCWSIAQLSNATFFSNGCMNRTLDVELYNCLPVPTDDVNFLDILEFKRKRGDELQELRIYIDELYQSILNSSDRDRARQTAIIKLDRLLKTIETLFEESKIKTFLTSLRRVITGDTCELACILGGDSISKGEFPFPSFGAIGFAGLCVLVKTMFMPRHNSNDKSCVYLKSIYRNFGFPNK